MTLVLASRSPQRRAILTQLGLEFRIVEPSYDELPLPLAPHELAERHSLGKARSVEPGAGETVLGVDTLVVIGDQVLGKPADAAEAARMLALLAGRTHHVVSGLTLRDAHGERTGHARTAVRFRPLDAGRSTSTSRAASGAGARAGTPSRRRGRHSCRTSRDASSTSSACRSRCSSRCWGAPSPRFRVRSRIALHPGAFARLAPGSANPQ